MPTFVDLFAGAGGLTLGLHQAGWDGILGADNWAEAVDTYRRNVTAHPVVRIDIGDLRGRELARLISDRPDWVVGGPPCQGYSTVGKRRRRDPRNELFHEFRRVVEALDPKGFLIENVLGLKDMRFESEVAAAFRELDYQVSFMVLTAADFGVPQLRRRVVFVGHKERGSFLGPPVLCAQDDYVTVWDAIGDLPPVGPGQTVMEYDTSPFTAYQKEMRDGNDHLHGHTAGNHPEHLVRAISFIPDGGNRRDIPERWQPRSGYHNSYSRLASWAPAVAVTSNMGKPSATRCVHPFQHRGLTAREGARLQGFPDRFHFLGGVVSQRLQIANAVPPILAQAVGEALLRDDLWL